MFTSAVRERVDKKNLSRQLIQGLAVATLRKAEEDFSDIIGWWTKEQHTGRPPIDLRLRAAAAYYAAGEKLKELVSEPETS